MICVKCEVVCFAHIKMTQSKVFFTVLALLATVTSVAGEAVCRYHMVYALFRADCANRNLSTVPDHLMPDIEILELSSNHIRQLDNNSFSCCSSIRQLYLQNNDIAHIASHVFNHLSGLRVLDFEGSQLTELPKNLPTSLVRLGIGSNPSIFVADPASPVLEISSLTSLIELKIGLTGLQAFPRFDGVIPSLVRLEIDNNPLKLIKPDNLAPLCGLKFLSVDNVPLFAGWKYQCDCLKFQKWASDFNVSVKPEINCISMDEKPGGCILEHRKDALQVREKCLSELKARKLLDESPVDSNTTIIGAQSDEKFICNCMIGSDSIIITLILSMNVCCILIVILLYIRYRRREHEQSKTVGGQNSDFLSVKYDHKAAEEKVLL